MPLRSTNPDVRQPLRSKRPEGFHDYVVLGREEVSDVGHSQSVGRRAVVEQGIETSTRLRSEIERELRQRGLDGQVFAYGEADAFGAVHLTATPAVAEAVRGMTQVEGVFDDRDSLRATK